MKLSNVVIGLFAAMLPLSIAAQYDETFWPCANGIFERFWGELDHVSNQYYIIDDYNALYLQKNINDSTFYFIEEIIGFIELGALDDSLDFPEVESFLVENQLFVIMPLIDYMTKNKFGQVLAYDDPKCDSYGISLIGKGTGAQLYEYKRIEKLPYETMLLWSLNENGKVLMEKYLSLTVKSICVDQIDVFDSMDGDSIGYLVSDDLVQVIEEQGDWVQVKYLKTDQIYWTYMSCLE